MAINRLTSINVPAQTDVDWESANDKLSKSFKNLNSPIQIVGSVIPQGSTFQVGDVIYFGDSDTAISGTPSKYVKLDITDAGATLTPEFVPDLTGVSFNKIYSGYYDADGNLFVFNEEDGVFDGHVTDPKTKYGKLYNDYVRNYRDGNDFEYPLGSETINDIFSDLSSLLPVVGQKRWVTGGRARKRVAGDVRFVETETFSYVERTSSTTLVFHGSRTTIAYSVSTGAVADTETIPAAGTVFTVTSGSSNNFGVASYLVGAFI